MNGGGFSGSQEKERKPVNCSVGVPLGISGTSSSHVRPPADPSVMASSINLSTVCALQGEAAIGSHQGVFVSTSFPAANSGQVLQAHGGHGAASLSSLSSSSVMASASGGIGSTNSGRSMSGSGADECPSASALVAAAYPLLVSAPMSLFVLRVYFLEYTDLVGSCGGEPVGHKPKPFRFRI